MNSGRERHLANREPATQRSRSGHLTLMTVALLLGAAVACGGGRGETVVPTTDPTTNPGTTGLTTSPQPVVTDVPPTLPPTLPPTTIDPERPQLWSHSCVDAIGDPAVEPIDAYAGQEFGPLGGEPGVRIAYPMPPVSEVQSTPVSRVLRVPGGTLISIGSDIWGESDLAATEYVLAVVDDSGAVRWRRCLPELRTSDLLLDRVRDVVDVKVFDARGDTAAWWAFDLRTGESWPEQERSADDLDAEAAKAYEWNNDIGFDPLPIFGPMRRLDGTGAVIWERPDLTSLGGEGFRSAVAADGVVLVHGCVGSPVDVTAAEWPACPLALLGLDVEDGHTLWQRDGTDYPTLVQGHYAIIETYPPSHTDARTFELLDTNTGKSVRGGLAGTPWTFSTECCGGDEHWRVEADGAVAWSLHEYVLNVWFPKANPGPGVTVDLFGAAAITVAVATPNYGVGLLSSCGAPECRPVAVTLSGFPPGEVVPISCRADAGAGLVDVEMVTSSVEVAADGSAVVDQVCVVPRNVTDVEIVVGGVEALGW